MAFVGCKKGKLAQVSLAKFWIREINLRGSQREQKAGEKNSRRVSNVGKGKTRSFFFRRIAV